MIFKVNILIKIINLCKIYVQRFIFEGLRIIQTTDNNYFAPEFVGDAVVVAVVGVGVGVGVYFSA